MPSAALWFWGSLGRTCAVACLGQMALAGTSFADTTLPTECGGASAPVTPVDRVARVYNEKVYFFAKPQFCPGSGTTDAHPPNCPWRRKGYVVRGDDVHESAATENFVCVTFRGTTGWMPTHNLCLHAKPRQGRGESIEYEDDNHLPCDDTRSIPSDEAFFSGSFESDTAQLKTEYVPPHRVRFRTILVDEGCHATLSGVAEINGSVGTDATGTTLTFRDDGVDLKAGSTSPCPNTGKEFYFDPGGSALASPLHGSSACNVDNAGLKKRPLVAFYYKLKAALAKDARNDVASMVRYPTVVNGPVGRKHSRLRNRQDFLAHYDEIINDCFKTSLREQRIGGLFCQDQGVGIANGLVWVNGDPNAPTIGTINVPACPKKQAP